jgi:hypothetical protein
MLKYVGDGKGNIMMQLIAIGGGTWVTDLSCQYATYQHWHISAKIRVGLVPANEDRR